MRISNVIHFHLENGIQNKLAKGSRKLLTVGTGGCLTEFARTWVEISRKKNEIIAKQ